MSISYAKIFKIMYNIKEMGNTNIRNKVRHKFDVINRQKIIHILFKSESPFYSKTQKNLQPHPIFCRT